MTGPGALNGIFRADLESIRYPLELKQGDYCQHSTFYYSRTCSDTSPLQCYQQI
jgi:hypothetical protein